ncbi:putative toxin-antitoxin system toxin component, PIN family [Undibacterium fentianense]|uniref:Toxin-antitoxin system toxin component, PIN family n=1 Tax=Undibacterium fentianense TaxID=2828728 RepID=A0A941E0F5_9BURK|nr:putative toxin-antitoxin system toxin component, PIN family [Undibacterium fentianense]MBR7798656.1 putative toxin-antitoxin system toxin component, PIN family [Undibacterium fentianense]
MKLKIVIDTNVCLDLFAFKDQRWQAMFEALQRGELYAISRSDCREEWLAVLHYSHLPIDDKTRPGIALLFDQYIRVETPAPTLERLPICSDKDDQKFLEIARDARVDVLITKDKALLKLARKIRHMNLFSIETPERFLLRLVANSQAL